MKAAELWKLLERHNIKFFSQENRQYWKTRLVKRPKRNNKGHIVFSTSDTFLGHTKISEHIIHIDFNIVTHTRTTEGDTKILIYPI
jgi:RNA binding exosome subunit